MDILIIGLEVIGQFMVLCLKKLVTMLNISIREGSNKDTNQY